MEANGASGGGEAGITPLFFWPRASTAPGSALPSWSRTAIRLTLSTLIGYSWSE